MRFLERKEWLDEHVPPYTFAHRRDIMNGNWKYDSPNVPGSHHESMFSPGADSYDRSTEYPDSMVHCTTLAWDHFVAEHVSRFSLLARRHAGHGVPLNARERAEMVAVQDTCAEFARAALVRLTLRRGMTSRIPFGGKPIIQIPPMKISTQRVTQPNETELNGEPLESLLLNRRFINESYTDIMKQVVGTGVKFGTPTFKSRWRLIMMAALSPLNGIMAASSVVTIPPPKSAIVGKEKSPVGKSPAAKEKEKPGDPHAVSAPPLGRFKSATLWSLPKGKIDHGKPDLDRLRELCELFITAFPEVAKSIIPRTKREIKIMKPEDIILVPQCSGELIICA